MIKSHENNVLVILSGPTAVGKTELSLKIARHFDAEIISSDSRQVYKEMNIGTACPSEEELKLVRHHFIAHVSIHDQYDAGIYEKEVISFLSDYFKEKSIALMTGGTGLYIKAVMLGLDEFPDIPDEITKQIKMDLETKGIGFLVDKLKKLDPVYHSQADLSNPHRLIRALSVAIHTSKPFSSFLGKKKATRSFKMVPVFLELERDVLYERINQRVDQMMENGLLEEAKSLYPFKKLKALQTVGYSELFSYMDNEITLDQAVELIKRNSRRYAKRQFTWFRKNEDWAKFKPDQLELIISHIKSHL